MTPRSRALPVVVLMVCLALGAIFTGATVHLENRAAAARFDRIADVVASQLGERIKQHIALLQATKSYYESLNGDLSADEFARYVASLGLRDRYSGIQGIGFAALLPGDRVAEGAARVRRNYGMPVTVYPPVTQDRAAPIVLLEPMDERNRHALGYDMFSDPTRRSAMLGALARGTAQATGPVELVQEITDDKQTGFLVYLPARVTTTNTGGATERQVAGFIYAPFRAGDLHQAALVDPRGVAPVTIRTVDTAQPDTTIFASSAKPVARPRTAFRDIDVAGRTWRVTVTEAAGFAQLTDHLPSVIVAALSLLLAIASMLVLRATQSTLAAASMSAEMAGNMARERELMLQELKHRIKNHITRIQAIARHTAASATGIDDFQTLFFSRLRAMADAQDLLTGGGDHADLAELIGREVGQMLGRDGVSGALDGPNVRLDARQAQALGLVTHELTTNAMKHGRATKDGCPAIRVRWRVADEGDGRLLHLDWVEPGARPPDNTDSAPSHRGFGSQLLEIMVEGELGGTLTRRFDADGMAIQIRFPLAA